MKIYIAGRITGKEDAARKVFAAAEKKLMEDEHLLHVEVYNPFKFDDNHDKSWESYMKVCIPKLCECDMIYMTKNWYSTGAELELTIAKKLNLIIKYEENE